MMVIHLLATVENREIVDWIDEEKLGLEGIFLPINDVNQLNLEANRFLVRSVEEYLTLPWNNDNYENNSFSYTTDFKPLEFVWIC